MKKWPRIWSLFSRALHKGLPGSAPYLSVVGYLWSPDRRHCAAFQHIYRLNDHVLVCDFYADIPVTHEGEEEARLVLTVEKDLPLRSGSRLSVKGVMFLPLGSSQMHLSWRFPLVLRQYWVTWVLRRILSSLAWSLTDHVFKKITSLLTQVSLLISLMQYIIVFKGFRKVWS